MNQCCLVGAVLRPPTTRFEGDGHQITDFVLSVLEPSTHAERKPYTVFIGCTAWGRSAEVCSLLQAADVVEVQGKLTWAKRKHKCGQEHSTLVVSVRDVHVLHPVLQPALTSIN